jgi:Family of unknown function (DUF5682)
LTVLANDEKSVSTPHYFGIRHHGPGSALSLLRALNELAPDCVLIEGPPEADSLIPVGMSPDIQPPVALLSYCPDDSALAVYHPFAVYSPEWQAMRWALSAQVPVRFIDLPLVIGLAIEQAQRKAELEATDDDATEEVEDASPQSTDEKAESADAAPISEDPLNWLARAAGYADGEAWWNQMIEERGDGEQVFVAIAEAMTTLREELGDLNKTPDDAKREALREAHMRQCVREAIKADFTKIAVVCGAWHVPALRADVTAKSDAALLKGLAKVKVQSTWVPWTYRHLTRASGYGAGVRSPGWYEHVWLSATSSTPRSVGWLARVARLMRERDLDCSSAHLIEAARLADSLAAMRERTSPGMDELREAARTVLTMGDDAALRFIDDALLIGDRLGSVPADVPMVPLQRDVEQQQKRLRLKAEALQRTLDLDLRQPNDLERSHLLHRLNLLDIPWGQVARTGRSARGTFHEVWTLSWEPGFVLKLIEASRFGQTLERAAISRTEEQALKETQLAPLSALLDQVLLADLPAGVHAVTDALQRRAAITGDTREMLAALPPLANVFRYGSVRQTDTAVVAAVLDGLIARASIGFSLACQSMDDDSAQDMRKLITAADGAIALRESESQTVAWRAAVTQTAMSEIAHELLQGLACRLLLDAALWSQEEVANALSRHLSPGNDANKAANWLDGFINRNAVVLLHDNTIWDLVDQWLAQLTPNNFVRVLPLVRRTFSVFSSGERRDLGQRAHRGTVGATAATATPSWDEARAALPIPLLRQLMGLPT